MKYKKKYVALAIFLSIIAPSAFSQSDMSIIKSRISREVFETNADAALAKTILTYKNSMKQNGSWPDINYEDKAATLWNPIKHLERILHFAAAYAKPKSLYTNNDELFQVIIKGLKYWCEKNPKSSNWWHNDINSPQHLGRILVVMSLGKEMLPDDLQKAAIAKMEESQPPFTFTGANKLDIAIHYIARAAITNNERLMATATREAFQPVEFTTKEGLQHDYSYLQHKEQLQISSYGLVFLIGEYRVASWLAGTKYAIPESKRLLLNNYFFNTFSKTLRGSYIDFNTEGRGISRTNILDKRKIVENNDVAGLFANILLVSPDRSAELDDIKARLLNKQPPSFNIKPSHLYFWRGDYTLHLRPKYSFNVRTVSERTVRTESGNKENMLGTVLPDGSSNIVRIGDEYYNLMPAWEWDKIPGVTARDYDTAVIMKTEWGIYGNTDFVGGVTDSIYGVTAYNQRYDDVSAKKGYFFFDNEVVCLGADIKSNAPQNITTTLNQSWAKGKVIITENGKSSKLNKTGNFSELNWVWHDSVAYIFPTKQNVSVSSAIQSGDWGKINYSRKGEVKGEVFKLWINHGKAPSDASYEYIVVPGIAENELSAYKLSDIQIISNTPKLQAVQHKGLGIIEAIFYEAGTFNIDGITFSTNKPCIVQLKDVNNRIVKMSISEPTQKAKEIQVVFASQRIKQKNMTISLPQAPYAGSSVAINIE